MTRVNFVLLLLTLVFAVSVVTTRHQARKLYGDLQKEQNFARNLDVEYGRLMLEQGTWAAHALIEHEASQRLGMVMPDPRSIEVVQGRTP